MQRFSLGLGTATLWLALAACGEGGSTSNGGECSSFEPCGGNIVGKWQIEDACFTNVEDAVGLQIDDPECADVVQDASFDLNGVYEFRKDGQGSESITLKMALVLDYSADCLKALAQGQAVDVPKTCAALEDGYGGLSSVKQASCKAAGGGCACDVSFTPTMVMDGGPYEVSGDDLKLGEGDGAPYCVDGDDLTMRLVDKDSRVHGVLRMKRID